MYTMYVHVCIVMNINYYREKKNLEVSGKWKHGMADSELCHNVSINLRRKKGGGVVGEQNRGEKKNQSFPSWMLRP